MSSKRAKRRKQCERKYPYPSEVAAKRDAFRLRQSTHEWIDAYRCEFCSQWHVGHVPKRVRQAIAARREAA
jgi:hypothetical protein